MSKLLSWRINFNEGGSIMKKGFLVAVLYGMFTIIMTILAGSFILAFIVRYSNISESIYSYITIGLGIFAMFIGGFIAGLKGRANGIVVGLLTGASFTLLTFFVQFLGYDLLFSYKQSLYHALYVI